MEIIISEPPKYPGITETPCKDCGRDILLMTTVGGSAIALDDRPGPFRIEQTDDGFRAVHRKATDGYSHHPSACPGRDDSATEEQTPARDAVSEELTRS